MKPGVYLSAAWGIAVAVVLILALSSAAEDQRQQQLLENLRRTTQADLQDTAAVEILEIEARQPQMRPAIIVQAWGRLRGRPRAALARARLEARIDGDLTAAINTASPDQERLHVLWECAAIIDAELAAAVHVRIAARAGERGNSARLVTDAAKALEADPLRTDPSLVTAGWQRLREAGTGPGWFTWAAQETPPMAQAVQTAQAAVTVALLRRLDAPDAATLVEPAWHALQVIGGLEKLPPSVVTRYAEVSRYHEVPNQAMIILMSLVSVIFIILGVVFRRLMVRRRQVDVGAETIENVEPIELETDAITLQRDQSADETFVG